MATYASVTTLSRDGQTFVRALVVCAKCRTSHPLDIPIAEWQRWQSGDLAQNALTSLDPAQRELLISAECVALAG